jgi:hypothetical protein
MSPELVSKFAIWRAKSLDGRLTEDDMREAIHALRQDRVGAQIASDKSRRAKAKMEIPSADDLLKEMGAM